jgi:hypothetical protein
MSRFRCPLLSLLAISLVPPSAAEVKLANPQIAQAAALMDGFAERTGLTSGRPQKRYLWTDAFAVCNFLGLARATGDERYRELALRLVDRVHHTLGRHRPDDPRRGWISGLDDAAGEEHPTRGGLRIGKELPERGPYDPFDDRLEWDRDGQYFHYLTRWMHALDLVARATGEARFNRWARELAAAAHDAFTLDPPRGGRPRMVWKMSIDLERALVASMGIHDPLDGLVTAIELETTAAALGGADSTLDLRHSAIRYATMIEGQDLTTTDPLGLGGLLMDANRLDGMLRDERSARAWILGAETLRALRLRLLESALDGLAGYVRQTELARPASLRLGFRELGLAIGLEAIEAMASAAASEQATASDAAVHSRTMTTLGRLAQFVPVGDRIEAFWLAPDHRATATWRDHLDINEVMLATRLAPTGCLSLPAIER